MKYYVGIDLGGTNIAAGVTDAEGNLLCKHSVKTLPEQGFTSVAARMCEAAEEVMRMSGIDQKDFAGLGVGVPGATDNKTGDVMLAENLKWQRVPLVQEMHKKIDLPILMGNDGDCAALGEMWAGNGRGLDSGILITIGTGIGSGIIIDKKIFTGGTGIGTEAGHMPLVFGGELCGCGQHGCYEAYASCTALVRQTKAAMEENQDSLMWELSRERGKVDGRTAFTAARRGDAAAQQVIDRYVCYLAAGIAGLVNVFRPEIVIIGGGVSNEGDPLLIPLNERIQEYCYGSDVIAPPKAIKAKLGNDAGIIGAALLCREL